MSRFRCGPRPARRSFDRVNLANREGTVYLQDIYQGSGLQGVPRGTVRNLRLFTYHFNYYGTSGIEDYVGMDGPWDVRRVLGTVPVAADGSADFTVPANTPIHLYFLVHQRPAGQPLYDVLGVDVVNVHHQKVCIFAF